MEKNHFDRNDIIKTDYALKCEHLGFWFPRLSKSFDCKNFGVLSYLEPTSGIQFINMIRIMHSLNQFAPK